MLPAPGNLTKPQSPSPPQQHPVSNNDGQLNDEVELLFDGRPGEATENSSLIDTMRSKLAYFSARCLEAYDWVSKKWSELTSHASADHQLVSISKPRNFQHRALPSELAQGLQNLESEKKQATAQDSFIHSDDMPTVLDSTEKNADEQAFDQYARLHKLDRGEGGSSSASQNFNDAAARHATQFLKLVEQRKSVAESQKETEFWLSSADQEKLAIANELLAQQDDKASKLIAQSAGKMGQIQRNSSQQYLSFMAWREWRDDTSQNPSYDQFSIPAAVAYAQELLISYAGKDHGKIPEMKALLQDASQLIGSEQMYATLAENIKLLNLLDEIKAPELHAAAPANSPQIPVAPSSSQAFEHSSIPAILEVSAPRSSLTESSPPAPPAPRLRSQQTATSPATVRVPALNTFDSDIQSVAYARLNQFFDDYIGLIDRGNVQIDRTDIFLPAMAAAANDFLEQATAAPDTVSDKRMFGAASFLINTYLQYQAEIRASGAS